MYSLGIVRVWRVQFTFVCTNWIRSENIYIFYKFIRSISFQVRRNK